MVNRTLNVIHRRVYHTPGLLPRWEILEAACNLANFSAYSTIQPNLERFFTARRDAFLIEILNHFVTFLSSLYQKRYSNRITRPRKNTGRIWVWLA